jgi:hypothetical protein
MGVLVDSLRQLSIRSGYNAMTPAQITPALISFVVNVPAHRASSHSDAIRIGIFGPLERSDRIEHVDRIIGVRAK